MARGPRPKKLSAEQAFQRRQWARGLLAQGHKEDALRYLQERKLGIWELPETHCFPLPKRPRDKLHYVNRDTLSPSPTLSSDAQGDTPGGEGVGVGGWDGNGNTTHPPGRNFQSIANTPPYDPAKEPSFEDREEGSWEKGEGVVPKQERVTAAEAVRAFVEEVGMEELAGFLERPKVTAPSWQIDPSQLMPEGPSIGESATELVVGTEAPPSPPDGLKSQGKGVAEPLLEGNALVKGMTGYEPAGPCTVYAVPREDAYPPETTLEVVGECLNKSLVKVSLPDGREVSMWSQGRRWPAGMKVRGRLESPTGTIVYEPLGE